MYLIIIILIISYHEVCFHDGVGEVNKIEKIFFLLTFYEKAKLIENYGF